MQLLKARLAALEARSVRTEGQLSRVESARLSASINALLVAVRPDGIDRLRPLLTRFDIGTETDSDRSMLAGLPTCHLTPHELVRMLDNLWHEV